MLFVAVATAPAVPPDIQIVAVVVVFDDESSVTPDTVQVDVLIVSLFSHVSQFIW
jgi:hypothetical protein